jgi:hypothetical protein
MSAYPRITVSGPAHLVRREVEEATLGHLQRVRLLGNRLLLGEKPGVADGQRGEMGDRLQALVANLVRLGGLTRGQGEDAVHLVALLHRDHVARAQVGIGDRGRRLVGHLDAARHVGERRLAALHDAAQHRVVGERILA